MAGLTIAQKIIKAHLVEGEMIKGSPIGLKKPYPVTVDQSALALPKMVFSGGKVGTQVCVAPQDLLKMVNAKTADITN